jgi:hypothetical protein
VEGELAVQIKFKNTGFRDSQAGVILRRCIFHGPHSMGSNRLSLQQVLAQAGLDPRKFGEKPAQLIDSIKPEWNPAEKHWDFFDDTTAQLEATSQASRLLNSYPAEPLKIEPEQATVVMDVPL